MKKAAFFSYMDNNTIPTFHSIQTVAFCLGDLREEMGRKDLEKCFPGS